MFKLLVSISVVLGYLGACSSNTSSGTANNGAVSAEDIASVDDITPAPIPPSASLPQSDDVIEQLPEPEVGIEDLLQLSDRKSISFNGSDQYITVPNNTLLDTWSNDRSFTWAVNVVADTSSGDQILPLVSRGQSSYYLKIDSTNQYVQIVGEDPSGAHLSTIFFTDLKFVRADDGTVNLPLTVTRNAEGTEKWYFETSLVKTFRNLSTTNSVETEPLLIGAKDGESTKFEGNLDLVSLWNIELSMSEIVELVSEYDPRNHSLFESNAVAVWPLGEDLIEDNENGSVVYDIRGGLNGSSVNMTADNFSLADQSLYDAVEILNYPSLTNTVINSADGSTMEGVVVKLVGSSSSFTDITNISGSFTFSEVPARLYALHVSAPGFVDYVTSFDSSDTNQIILSPEIDDATTEDFRILTTWNEEPLDLDTFVVVYNSFGIPVDMIHPADANYEDGTFSVTVDNSSSTSFGTESISIYGLPEGFMFKVLVAEFSGQGVTEATDVRIIVQQGNSILDEFSVNQVQNPDASTKTFFEIGLFRNNSFETTLEYVTAI